MYIDHFSCISVYYSKVSTRFLVDLDLFENQCFPLAKRAEQTLVARPFTQRSTRAARRRRRYVEAQAVKRHRDRLVRAAAPHQNQLSRGPVVPAQGCAGVARPKLILTSKPLCSARRCRDRDDQQGGRTEPRSAAVRAGRRGGAGEDMPRCATCPHHRWSVVTACVCGAGACVWGY